MNKKRNKIDVLLIFFLLSLCSIFLFVNDVKVLLNLNQIQLGYKEYIESAYVFKSPMQGLSTNDSQIVNFDSNYEISVSLNGGNDYIPYNNSAVKDFKVNDISRHIISYRSKSEGFNLPQTSTFLVKAKHKHKNSETKPIQLSYFNLIDSELPTVSLVVSEKRLI